MKEKKIRGFDFIRAFAIFFVFMAHIINKQSHNEIILLIERSISPGLTMSLLGFISGYLLTFKYRNSFDGSFYIKRFSKIYSSLFLCLAIIVILHLILSYNVINLHTVIHFMGLSFFMWLLQVPNISSVGGGLWFVTIISIMYLTLPLISSIYQHKNAYIHLLLLILTCLMLSCIVNTISAWNVIIAFNIGCYMGLNSKIEKLSQRSIWFYCITTIIILIISGLLIFLSTSNIISHKITGLLFPLYPFFVAPLLFKIGNSLTGFAQRFTEWFSSISYEVYIIHFYFINEYFSDLFPAIDSMLLQMLISLAIVLPLAHVLSKIGSQISKIIINYFIK